MKIINYLILIIFVILFSNFLNAKEKKVCNCIFSERVYQKYLNDLPTLNFDSAFYISVGKDMDGNKVYTYSSDWHSK